MPPPPSRELPPLDPLTGTNLSTLPPSKESDILLAHQYSPFRNAVVLGTSVRASMSDEEIAAIDSTAVPNNEEGEARCLPEFVVHRRSPGHSVAAECPFSGWCATRRLPQVSPGQRAAARWSSTSTACCARQMSRRAWSIGRCLCGGQTMGNGIAHMWSSATWVRGNACCKRGGGTPATVRPQGGDRPARAV